jgi:D-alanyl-D-alanine carboxypeptidase/D-alanyl-D-alanine-endopeptidase (penicillin-binding protein 4)
VAASGIKNVGDIVGDDRWFADERRPLGWSWDDLKFGHGTSISAIAVNDSIVSLRVSPSDDVGASPQAFWVDDGPSFFHLKNEAKTSDSTGERALRLERRIGDRTARLYGELPVGSRSVTLDLGVDNSAYLAAWYFKRALENEGVSVSGELRTRRRPLQYADEPILADPNDPTAQSRCIARAQPVSGDTVIASLQPAPIRDIVTEINRESQNLYAEVLLRQLGRAAGTGSSFCGLLQIQEFLNEIGVPHTSYDFADGSGLSNYNRVTPATITALLRHAAAEPWGEAYRESLPIGGASTGTLKYRFRGTALAGKIFAKTGTLNHVDALSGYMQARSGETLVFSIIVNDRPLESPSAMPQIDSVLLNIAEQY